MSILSWGIEQMERGRLPDAVVRWGIRRLCRERLAQRDHGSPERNQAALEEFVTACRASEVAPIPDKANQQHYEVPAEFFALVLGPHRKYSCCYWPPEVRTLEEAEAAALTQTCDHAELEDGLEILELGCGWGSLSLWMAERYPSASITAVSNSHSQRNAIEADAESRGLSNLTVITADMNTFDAPGRYDRVVSVEMFEHMRNHEELLKRISGWLRPEGKLFVHIFCHRQFAYPFESEGEADWMSEHFFTGGMMPSTNLFQHYGEDLAVEQKWDWNGRHYMQTCNAWLENFDRHRQRIRVILSTTYGERDVDRWMQRWRVFFMACAELFGLDGGDEWFVSHYRFRQVDSVAPNVNSGAMHIPELTGLKEPS